MMCFRLGRIFRRIGRHFASGVRCLLLRRVALLGGFSG